MEDNRIPETDHVEQAANETRFEYLGKTYTLPRYIAQYVEDPSVSHKTLRDCSTWLMYLVSLYDEKEARWNVKADWIDLLRHPFFEKSLRELQFHLGFKDITGFLNSLSIRTENNPPIPTHCLATYHYISFIQNKEFRQAEVREKIQKILEERGGISDAL